MTNCLVGDMNSSFLEVKAFKYLRELLSIHWLRPETALWRTFDCLLMEKYGNISGNSIDLGCGDGTMSYIMAGGIIDKYDVFMEIGQLQNYNAGADIHNQNPESPLIADNTTLRYKFELGVDHKEGLINKARRFSDFYSNVAIFNLNQKMDLEDGYFDSAFSNILYWLKDIDSVLREWCRVLKDKAKLHLFVPTASFRGKAWFYYSAPHTGDNKYLNYFDRGYGSLINHCYNTTQWAAFFLRNGFAVADHHLYLTNSVMNIWNIGTRPITPLLINMSTMLSQEDRDIAKSEWVDYFFKFFMPIIEGEFERNVNENDAAFHFFVLEKK